MADARSLLRQQRAARRIAHPHAAYSDTGKLLCTLCREHVKTESLWDAHIHGEAHRSRSRQTAAKAQVGDADGKDHHQQSRGVASQKRKHDDVVVEEMDHGGGRGESPTAAVVNDHDNDPADGPRMKRSKTAAAAEDTSTPNKGHTRTRTRTPPPSLSCRSSQTPSQGIELQIPSRPATPRDSTNAAASSSVSASSSATAATASQPARQVLTAGPPISSSTTTTTTAAPAASNGPKTNNSTQAQVDEDEWAAFEADIAATTSASYDEGTISAPAMTVEESARLREARQDGDDGDEDPRRRTSKPEADLADEREDAARALEDEMEEMRGLEAKVLRLKERRDALRQQQQQQQQQQQRAASHGPDEKRVDDTGAKQPPTTTTDRGGGKENAVGVAGEEDELDESEDDGEDDWDGFRFRTGLAR
ncbi:Zinc finger protein-like protein [Hapsidospora chrysogenum ATCC 11550]|uniref:Zinc finger protein-like protein n=1 Tax=Hapsidospora chrysogenum (strain ATCC 11550 / CBS 779.69 / DSM 880 / IAM 14645 / JCM 23072 / IMI 49137) TaxID=857340 RepID=A0A086T3N3_HAPC1|nr:Zinc finger protein-like protein [Hapsidospora chrysogenum ATCC 11550]